jgi:hypothetical protein
MQREGCFGVRGGARGRPSKASCPACWCSLTVLDSSTHGLSLCHWSGDPPILPFLPDDLASKANIVIDPMELQAATMDDLDEDEEPAPAAAQVWQ